MSPHVVTVACLVALISTAYGALSPSEWTAEQHRLWALVESGRRADASNLTAAAVPPHERWWTAADAANPVLYFLHIHKCGGSTVCSMAQNAFPGRVNPNNNCNVPDNLWWAKRRDQDRHFQKGAYIGRTREDMDFVFQHIKRHRWQYVASEGSLEEQPLFHGGPYFYMVALRDPLAWVLSMFNYGWQYNYHREHSLSEVLGGAFWWRPNFFTRRLCGTQCMLFEELSDEHFLRAITLLEHFDAVLILEQWEESLEALAKSFPQLANAGRGHHINPAQKRVTEEDMTPEDIQNFRRISQMDELVYFRAKQLLASRANSHNRR